MTGTASPRAAIRVALAGAGRWGWNLARNLADLEVLSVVADPDPDVRRRVLVEFPQVSVVTGLREALTAEVDALVLATPAATHAELAVESLRAGKHVLVDKPFALSVADAERVVEEAQVVGKVLMAGHLLLYQPAIVWLRDYLSSGAIGEVATLYQDRLSLGTVRSVENSLWSLGVHDVAAILYLLGGQPTRVTAWGQAITQPEVEDDMHLHMAFPGGVEGHVHSSWLWPEQRRRLTVVGTEGMVVYDESDHTVRRYDRHVDADLSVYDGGDELLFTGDPHPLKLELEHFLSCVKDGTEPRSSGRSAVEVIRVLGEADEQLRAHREDS